MKRLFAGIFVFLALSLGPAVALNVQESFNYANGSTLNGQNGGTGWGGAWFGSNTPTVTSPGLTFPGDTTTGNKATLGYDGTTYTIFRSLGTNVDGSVAENVSLSFLFNITGNDADTGIRFSGLSLFSGTSNELIFFGKPGNTTDIGFEKYSGGNLVDGVSVAYSSATVFKFQADFVLSVSGESTVTINLSENTGAGTLLATWSNLSLGTGFSFDTVRLIRDFALDNGIDAQADEINIVPEPSTFVLLGLGVAGVFAIRRWRRA